MQNVVEHLHKNGYLLLSTPCGADIINVQPEWTYHKIEYSSASLYDFLRRYFNVILRPDNSTLPHLDIFDQLKEREIHYLLFMNPIVCKDPIVVENPYK